MGNPFQDQSPWPQNHMTYTTTTEVTGKKWLRKNSTAPSENNVFNFKDPGNTTTTTTTTTQPAIGMMAETVETKVVKCSVDDISGLTFESWRKPFPTTTTYGIPKVLMLDTIMATHDDCYDRVDAWAGAQLNARNYGYDGDFRLEEIMQQA